MAGENGVSERITQIVLTLVPMGVPDQYKVQVEHNGVDGGWPTVYAALLGGLDVVVNQVTPGRNVGQSPVFQALLNVLRTFMQGLLQVNEQGPRIERVTELPRTAPKEWFKN